MLVIVVLCGVGLISVKAEAPSNEAIPTYIKQCHDGDPNLINCFIEAIHHLRPYLAKGIPEIELPSVEPFKMEELALSLTTGPNGYKVALKDIDIFGASNFTMKKLSYQKQVGVSLPAEIHFFTTSEHNFEYFLELVDFVAVEYKKRLSDEAKPFEAVIHIPILKIFSRYESSGVLIILPASGNGTFNGQLEGLDAIVNGRVSVNEKANNKKYLHVDSLNVDLTVNNVHLLVKNIYRNNIILTQAINLFLRENGMEVFKIMLPQLRKKLSGLFMSISNSLLSHVPLSTFYVRKDASRQ